VKEQFVEHRFSKDRLSMLSQVNMILLEYEIQGFRLSLRQLYYQLVARGIVENSQRSYKNIGNLVSVGRQAGKIDWRMIEDRNRDTMTVPHWENPGEIIRTAAREFAIDKWEGQEYHIEVMVEKDALSGVLEPVCRDLDIGITAAKGYCSSSTMYEIGKRLFRKSKNEYKQICVIYLGDHDPSGIDMTRDIEERLQMYSRLGSGEIEVVRLALNWGQVQDWKPPENPAKQTDSRFKRYVRQFGTSSWELDAVEPKRLARLIQEEVEQRIDHGVWHDRAAMEDSMKDELRRFSNTYKG
jgi:hypothetical protein